MIINKEKLSSILNRAGEYIKKIDEEYYMYHYTAINTGMRQNEIFTLNKRIVEVDEKEIKIITEKTGKIRKIEIEKVHKIILERYKRNVSPFQKITYNTLNYALKKGGIKNITVNGTKPETTHLYRHNYCKQLHEKNKNIKEVAEILNISEQTAKNYIMSIIEQKEFVTISKLNK